MPLIPTAEEVLVDRINVENHQSFAVEDLAFGDPEPAVDTETAAGCDLQIRVASSGNGHAIGSTLVYYSKLGFDEVYTSPTGNNPLRIPVDFNTVKTAHDCIPAIRQYFGNDLRPEDIVDTKVDALAKTVLIQATPTAKGWKGAVTAMLYPGDPQIENNFTDKPIVGYSYPYFNTKVGQGAIYSYPYNYDDFSAELAAAGTTIDLERLALIIRLVTRDEWVVYRNPIDFNLKEARVIYNGTNKPEFPTNPTYDNVMIVELALYCINFGGRIYLHYNNAV